ncbi:MAG: RNA polymerase sigma factor SigJ [Rhodobiaceae bacterium]|nr:RNA polymerase sigma factor SigJ [Rhodobiaceae bacterium]
MRPSNKSSHLATAGHEQAGQVFERVRPRLWQIAYRMLASFADADDAVQDTYIKWHGVEHRTIENPEAWLVTACTRRCIDLLRASQRTRVDYVDMWLPEPVIGDPVETPDDHVALAESLRVAFLLLLDRLSATERAAYLLRDVFDYTYGDIATVLTKSEAACRQIVSRAKKRLEAGREAGGLSEERHAVLLETFLETLASGDTDGLARVLAADVELIGDGGGKAPATLEVIKRADGVAAFLITVWRNVWKNFEVEVTPVNGTPGFLLWHENIVVGAVSLAATEAGTLRRVYIVRNPDKLRHLNLPSTDG